MPTEGVFLQEEAIYRNGKLLIDPDNVFWALTSGNGGKKTAEEKIWSLYNRVKPRLDAEMREFRFKVDLNSVYINPTDKCNADCPYCYIPQEKRRYGKSVTESGLRHILKKLDKYFDAYRKKYSAKPIIIYHGSEPLMVKDMLFSSIKEFASEFHFGIQTNAILLEKEDVEFLKSCKVSVGISLDSYGAETNNRTRKTSGKESFRNAIRAIDWFNGYEGLSVISTVTRYNVKDLPGLVRFLHSKKVGCVLLNPVRTTRKSVVRLRPDEDELARYFMKAVKEAIRLSRVLKRRIIIANFSNIILGIVAPQARRLMCDISPCGGGRCFFAITAGGDMIPCGEFIGLEDFYGGNIFKSSVKKGLSSPAFREVRKRVVENIEDCDECLYRNVCGAPCPAEMQSLHKDMHTKSPYCEFYKKIISYAFKLISDDEVGHLFNKEAIQDLKYEYKLKI